MPDTLPPPMFLADSRGLDFLNTLAVPVDTEVEWLASGEDLLAWLQSAGLLSAEAADEVRSVAKPSELDDAAAKARGLREWFRGFVRQYRGEPLTRKAIAELEPLNELLARDEEFSQIVPSSDEASLLAFVPRRRWRSADSLLFPITKTLAELLTAADFSDVKQCEGPGCVLHFLDTTRDRRRRWCSMAVCGNRAKQAALRLRRAANAGS